MLDYDTISGEHFRIFWHQSSNNWALCDLSTNGTVVNKTFVGQGLTTNLQEGDVVSIPISRQQCLHLRFTLKTRGAHAEDMLVMQQRVLDAHRNKEDLEMKIQDMRGLKRSREADQLEQTQVLLKERAELQKKLEKTREFIDRASAKKAIIDQVSGDVLATLEGLYDELLACQVRSSRWQGIVCAQQHFLRDMLSVNRAVQMSLHVENYSIDSLRSELGELRAILPLNGATTTSPSQPAMALPAR